MQDNPFLPAYAMHYPSQSTIAALSIALFLPPLSPPLRRLTLSQVRKAGARALPFRSTLRHPDEQERRAAT
ncbi:hypothetical protein Poly30_56250 [Planctomycetes bacterium Poly30]|uniref:Uncharacterized protein n=1 Tax=Saltatorellus ferox TaxID=2528018 RepID=A0A518F148_9BACT|nr:hypothetical protein Poly30_56250 [Planctomycetes bacterium Poly30]